MTAPRPPPTALPWTQNKTVTVTFAPILHQLTASVADGQGIIMPTGGTFEEGTVVDLTATPAPGYHVVSWSGTDDDSSTATTNMVTMSADQSVTVTFELIEYALTASVADGQGTVCTRQRDLCTSYGG